MNDLKYSYTGDTFLAITGTLQARLYDRNGEEKYAFKAFEFANLKLLGLHISKVTLISAT